MGGCSKYVLICSIQVRNVAGADLISSSRRVEQIFLHFESAENNARRPRDVAQTGKDAAKWSHLWVFFSIGVYLTFLIGQKNWQNQESFPSTDGNGAPQSATVVDLQ
jgi:hypothetical protein